MTCRLNLKRDGIQSEGTIPVVAYHRGIVPFSHNSLLINDSSNKIHELSINFGCESMKNKV